MNAEVAFALGREPVTATLPPNRCVPSLDVSESTRDLRGFPLFDLTPTAVGTQWIGAPRSKVAGWFQESCRRLQELAEIEQDWDSYGAAPPNQAAVSLAKNVLRQLGQAGFSPPCINASAEEGICMSFRNGSLYADIECFNSGEVLAAISGGASKQRVWEVGSSAQEIGRSVRLIWTHLNSRNA